MDEVLRHLVHTEFQLNNKTIFKNYNQMKTLTKLTLKKMATMVLCLMLPFGVSAQTTASLQNAIKTAETFFSTAVLTDYMPGAVENYRDALLAAKACLAQTSVAQTVINARTTALTTARTTLNSSKGKSYDIDGLSDGYDVVRGFRHPGGLHTKADFDRIKQQLKDGNTKVTAAYNKLKSAAYAQSSAATYPVETIVRGGGSGENYINAARGAAIAYQNGLRWQIEGNEACAKHAVQVLMQWARTTKGIGGDSNWALAAGLYGYEFAQAAELVRDYPGWSESDFNEFKQWILNVWYPASMQFLRGRNGTWENPDHWWEAPGHYWSNWGLCNALAVISYGVLCDDVYIYNQGMSFFKYDQVGTFVNPRTANPIKTDGLTEFLGNLVVTTSKSDLETGAYGELGQMEESGRDTGHAAMALGLAIDIAHQGWNQGDDLFSYMNHRLAAGIEFVAAQTLSVEGLPWTNLMYVEKGLNGYDGREWVMTAPALGAQMRPYWGTVIGHYEGIKGVEMPFSKRAYNNVGIDEGGQGATSGGYDHLGYSVLLNTYDGVAPAEKVPTELSPKMEYTGSLTDLIPSLAVERKLGNINGTTISHSELGGLINHYRTNNNVGLPKGQTVKLMPQLPEGETNTGKWEWSTGETTQDITVSTDKSYIYRVTYTNANGVKSEQAFSLATQGDCNPMKMAATALVNDEEVDPENIVAFYGDKVTLRLNGGGGYGTYLWDNGSTSSELSLNYVVRDRAVSGMFISQGGRKQPFTFNIKVQTIRPCISVNGVVMEDTLSAIVNPDDEVILQPMVSEGFVNPTFAWSDGSTDKSLKIAKVETSGDYTFNISTEDVSLSHTYEIYVLDDREYDLENGDYVIVEKATGRALTYQDEKLVFADLVTDADGFNHPSQVWTTEQNVTAQGKIRYYFGLLENGKRLSIAARLVDGIGSSFVITGAKGADEVNIKSTLSKYWTIKEDGTLAINGTELKSLPYLIIPAKVNPTGISAVTVEDALTQGLVFDIAGRRVSTLKQGIYIVGGKKVLVK